ncbi:MAG TPA: phage integrase SAM-like domain-containing protein, partial [Saprospiraceae bacterium]|nr:phage integrase SAM-like domain-containing protein [Saprospiraceae bacterium]
MVRAYTKFFDLRYSTGLYIDQNHWDEDYQLPITDVYNILKSTAKNDPKEKERKDIYLKVINEQLKRDPGYRAEMGFLVNQLMKYKAEINRIYETLYSISPIVKKDRLKLELDKVFRMDRLIKQTDNRFFASFDEFLTVHEKQFKPTTIQKYKTTIKRLRQYEVEHNNKLEFASINMEFYESFRNDLLFDGLTDNSIAKYFNTIKAFLRWSYEREYHTNGIFLKKQFSSKSKVKNDIVTLNKDEINALRDYDFSDNVRLDRVRDIFLFMIYTGQRISDITNFNPQDVRNGVWKFHQYKTGTLIEIDLNITKLPLEILKKYDFKMPIISEQKFNSYLKEVGEKV